MQTLWSKHALTKNGWEQDVAIIIGENGRITSVTASQPATGQRLDILLPAPANAHSHGFQRALAGMTERRGPNSQDTFWTWRKLMFRFLDRLTPEHVEAITAYVQMEMLEAGYATNVEFHYLHHQPDGTPYASIDETSQRIIAAASQTGIGLTLLPVHYQYGGCDKRDLNAGQIRFKNTADQFATLHEKARQSLRMLPADTRLGVAPHSLRAVAPEDLSQITALAKGGPVHMHLAEQIAEVKELQTAWGKRPVEWLLQNMAVDHNWCLIHCTQMLPHETTALAKTGAVAGLCPITESNLGDGIFDGLRWLKAGGKIAIGSDSNVRISLTEELRTLEYSQRLRDRSRAALATSEQSTGRRIFSEITQGGAQAAGRGTGNIAVGEWADLMALDGNAVDLEGREGDAILDSFIFAGDDSMVNDVWAAGRHLVKDGKHLLHDDISARYRATIAQLRDTI